MFVTLPEFEYHRPQTVSAALDLLDQYGGGSTVMAGGTDLLVDMRYRIRVPEHVIDLKGIEELGKLTFQPGNGLVIGAAVTLNRLLEYDAVQSRFGALHDALEDMCDDQVRNRATLAGNLCTASPAADCAPPLLVFDAKVEVASPAGRRMVDLPDLFTGVKETSLGRDEMVTAVHIPEPPLDAQSRYLKGKRSSEDCAIVGVAALVARWDDPRDRVVRLAYSSVAPTPVRVYDVERIFKQDKPWGDLVEEAVSAALNRVSPISDVRSSKEYRVHLIDVLTRLALRELLGGRR
ncbi:MAG: FAD binding domain-containing protein [Candidatus Geothermarchaeales archaeon]